jgi:hypothetical protein
MIKTNANKNSLKEIREREKAEKDKGYRDQCETILTTRIGGDSSRIAELSNKNKGLWYLPALDEEGNVEKMMVLKPIDRNILSYRQYQNCRRWTICFPRSRNERVHHKGV